MYVGKFVSFWFLISILVAGPVRADIVGGDEVQDQDSVRRSTVGLFSPDQNGRGGGALCTASIIGKNIALTAAHCVQPGSKPILLFGRDIHSPDTVKRPVTASRVNPAWATHKGKGMDEGDIALVKFAGGLPRGYGSVKINRSEANLTKGTAAVLAGYGISNAQTHAGAGVLRKTSISIENPRRGKSEMILNQSHGRGACHGDSGGPAFVNAGGQPVLAGVTNRSYPASAPDDCGHKVVYTKVNAYRPWIAKEAKTLRAGGDSGAVLAAHRIERRRVSERLRAQRVAGHSQHSRSLKLPKASRHAKR